MPVRVAQLAGLPGLLGRVPPGLARSLAEEGHEAGDATGLESPTFSEAPLESVLTGLLTQVRRQERRRGGLSAAL